MKMIVALGNPGDEYALTKHNVGFIIVDEIYRADNFKFEKKFNTMIYKASHRGEKYLVVKPQTYMNLSGIAVSQIANYYQIKLDDILVIYDDINFAPGKFKIKASGSAGGHNGIDNIIQQMASQKIARIKVGVGKNNSELKKYVLSNFNQQDLQLIKNQIANYQKIIEDFITNDINYLMNNYNKK